MLWVFVHFVLKSILTVYHFVSYVYKTWEQNSSRLIFFLLTWFHSASSQFHANWCEQLWNAQHAVYPFHSLVLMRVHAPATLHRKENWTMKWKKCFEYKELSVEGSGGGGTGDGGAVRCLTQGRSRSGGKIRQLVLLTNQCQFVKPKTRMLTCWQFDRRLKPPWQACECNNGNRQDNKAQLKKNNNNKI